MSAISANPPQPPALARHLNLHSLRVGVLLLAVAILNALDLLYTLFAQRIGWLNEVNPLTAIFLQFGLFPSFVCFKILMVLCGVGILWKLRASRLTLPACWILFLAYAWLGVIWIQWVRTVNSVYEIRLSSAVP